MEFYCVKKNLVLFYFYSNFVQIQMIVKVAKILRGFPSYASLVFLFFDSIEIVLLNVILPVRYQHCLYIIYTDYSIHYMLWANYSMVTLLF